ncbi:FAD-binding oxidoreductase [Myxococcota bacterium]|nr:FAD-binding oxidoreductase [Myxococcota bacterium]
MRSYENESFWLATLGSDLAPRPALDTDRRCDIAIVGAGYTGLWTAHALLERDPSLRVEICESEIAGAGASGRNGGWCMGAMSGLHALFSDPDRRDGAVRLQRQLFATVDEIGRTARELKIDCEFAKGGMLRLASTPAHRQPMDEEISRLRALGFNQDDYRLLDPRECRRRIRGRDFLGALYTPHVAALNPARLVRGLASSLEARGVRIFERSPVRHIHRHGIATDRAQLQADRVVVATEGYTPTLPGFRRHLVPIHSMMVATEPLPPALWETIGLERRETFADARRITTYGQRTADDRIAFGSRGLYHYGSHVRNLFSERDRNFRVVTQALFSILPQLASVRLTHHWGGALGVPRDSRPAFGIDERTGIAHGGGYVGEGVAASHLIGHALADLLCGIPSPAMELPWLHRNFPKWEPEPLRWLGISAVRRMGEAADRSEFAGRDANRLFKRVFDAATGH